MDLLTDDEKKYTTPKVPAYPLRFEPIYQYRLWAGRRLAELLTTTLPTGPIGEAWLLGDRDDHASRVSEGPLKVQTIGQLLERFPEQMLGKLARQRDVSAGESVAFQSRILGVGTAGPLSWSTDIGSVTNDGIYTAPTGSASDSFAVVTACVQGTQICDQERLGVHPFRITPSLALLAPGRTVQLDGIQASATVTPTWQLNGPGTLLPGGLYTASSQLADGGGIPIAGTYSGVIETASLGVTGDFPGLVNRVSDYFDLNQYPFPLGTWTVNVGTAGNKAYVVSTNKIDFVTDNNYYWMDIYDITNPVNPVWMDAVEPAMRPQSTAYCDGFLYEIAYSDFSAGVPYPAAIAIYDLSGSQPQLTTKQFLPLVLSSQSGCLLTQVSSTVPMIADLYQLKSGGVVHSQYILQTSDTSTTGRTATSDGSRIYVKLPQAQQDLVVYDLTTQTPTQVGVVDTGDTLASQLTLAGNLLFLTPPLGDQIFSHVFDISNSQPMFLGNLPAGAVIASSNTTALTGNYDTGLQMVDFSQPLQPVVTANMFDFVDARYTAALVANHILSSEGIIPSLQWLFHDSLPRIFPSPDVADPLMSLASSLAHCTLACLLLIAIIIILDKWRATRRGLPPVRE